MNRLKGIKNNVDAFVEGDQELWIAIRNIADLVERIKVHEEIDKRDRQIETNLTKVQEGWIDAINAGMINQHGNSKETINQIFQSILLHLHDEN